MWKEAATAGVILDKRLQRFKELYDKLSHITIYDIDELLICTKNCSFIVSKFKEYYFRLFILDSENFDCATLEHLWNTTIHIIRNKFRNIKNVYYIKFKYTINNVDVEIMTKRNHNTIYLNNIHNKYSGLHFICDKNDEIINLCENLLDKYPQIKFIIQEDDKIHFCWKNVGWRCANINRSLKDGHKIYYYLLSNLNPEFAKELINYAKLSKL